MFRLILNFLYCFVYLLLKSGVCAFICSVVLILGQFAFLLAYLVMKINITVLHKCSECPLQSPKLKEKKEKRRICGLINTVLQTKIRKSATTKWIL